MTADRSTLLRNAETLVRLGELRRAVDEYLRVLQAEPRDWTTAILVGELYLGLGDTDRAQQYFVRTADGLRAEGLLTQAAALYDRILTMEPREAEAPVDAQITGVPDLERVFEGFRRQAADSTIEAHAEAQLLSGEALIAAGRAAEGLAVLERAAKAPRLRFRAASLVARTYREAGDSHRAVEWFELAAEAPAPTPDDGRRLLYDLADTLESMGEGARALAAFLELQTEAGTYRDIAARIARLAAAGAGG